MSSSIRYRIKLNCFCFVLQLDGLSEGLVVGHGLGDANTPWFDLLSTGSGYNLGLILTSDGSFIPSAVNVDGKPCDITVTAS
jgi:hypothetical protein